MVVDGVIVNGRIELKLPAEWPEGARVTVTLAEEESEDIEFDPPPETETHEEFLASLRKEIADIKAGIPGIPVEEAFAQIARECNLPPVPRK